MRPVQGGTAWEKSLGVGGAVVWPYVDWQMGNLLSAIGVIA